VPRQLDLFASPCAQCGRCDFLYPCRGQTICTHCLRTVEEGIAAQMEAPGYRPQFGHHDSGGRLMRGRKKQ